MFFQIISFSNLHTYNENKSTHTGVTPIIDHYYENDAFMK